MRFWMLRTSMTRVMMRHKVYPYPKSRNRNSALFTIIAFMGFASCPSPHLWVRLEHEKNPINTSIAKIARMLFLDLGYFYVNVLYFFRL
jgi:hypothetical protein